MFCRLRGREIVSKIFHSHLIKQTNHRQIIPISKANFPSFQTQQKEQQLEQEKELPIIINVSSTQSESKSESKSKLHINVNKTNEEAFKNWSWSWFWKGFFRTCLFVGVSMAGGDIVCQQLLFNAVIERTWDSTRSFHMWLIGSFCTGPFNYIYMILLEKLFPGTQLSRIIAKVGMNAIYAFFFSLPLLFTSVTLLQPDKKLVDAFSKIKQDLVPTFIVGSIYWPLINVINFRFVPVHHRTIFSSFFGVIWNIYLSFKANKKNLRD